MAANQTQSRRTKGRHRCPNTISETGHSPGKIPRVRFRAVDKLFNHMSKL